MASSIMKWTPPSFMSDDDLWVTYALRFLLIFNIIVLCFQGYFLATSFPISGTKDIVGMVLALIVIVCTVSLTTLLFGLVFRPKPHYATICCGLAIVLTSGSFLWLLVNVIFFSTVHSRGLWWSGCSTVCAGLTTFVMYKAYQYLMYNCDDNGVNSVDYFATIDNPVGVAQKQIDEKAGERNMSNAGL